MIKLYWLKYIHLFGNWWLDLDLIDSTLFWDQLVGKILIYLLSQTERLRYVFAHLLFFEILLPLFDTVVLLVDFLEILVHFLFLAESHILVMDLLFSLVLASLHVLKFVLATHYCAAFLASYLVIAELDESLAVVALHAGPALCKIILGRVSSDTHHVSLHLTW